MRAKIGDVVIDKTYNKKGNLAIVVGEGISQPILIDHNGGITMDKLRDYFAVWDELEVIGHIDFEKVWEEAVLTADRKTEPTISKMEQVEDEPQTDCEDVWRAGYKTGYDKGFRDARKVNDSQKLVKDLVKAFGEDGTWLERQGVYTLTLAEAKQRAVDIIESVTQTETQNSNLTLEKDECAKEYEELGLKELKELIKADRKTEPQKKEVEWVYNKRERLWYPYSNGELLFKTENSSEKPNNSTISKMEQVDKDINVRSKDEPQWTKENCKGCKYNEYPYDSGTCFVRVCINGNKYEPKDEPQTERSE